MQDALNKPRTPGRDERQQESVRWFDHPLSFFFSIKMVLCCRCNRTGQCRGCACVKAGNLCSNCLPSRLGSCSNVSPAINANTTPTLHANTMNRHVPVYNEMSTTTPTSRTATTPTSTTSCSQIPAAAAASLAVTVKWHPHLKLIQQQPNSNSSTPQYSGSPRDLAFPHHPCPTHPFSSQCQTPTSGETDIVTFCKSGRHTIKSLSGGRTASKCPLVALASPLWQRWLNYTTILPLDLHWNPSL